MKYITSKFFVSTVSFFIILFTVLNCYSYRTLGDSLKYHWNHCNITDEFQIDLWQLRLSSKYLSPQNPAGSHM